MRKARERQLVLREEFEPQFEPDMSFLPSEQPVKRLGVEYGDAG